MLKKTVLYNSKYSVLKSLFGNYDQPNNNEQPNNNKFTKLSYEIGHAMHEKYKSIGYNSYTGVPDCVESTIRDLINYLILDDNNNLDISKLPNTTLVEVQNFYNKYNTLEKQYDDNLRNEWISIFNTTIKTSLEKKYPDITFYNDRGSQYQDIKSTFIIFTNVLMIIFGDNQQTPLEYTNNAQKICSEKLISIFLKFNRSDVSIIFEPNQNIMKIILDNYIEFHIYDGHSLMAPSRIKNIFGQIATDNTCQNNMPILSKLIGESGKKRQEVSRYYDILLQDKTSSPKETLLCLFYNNFNPHRDMDMNLVDMHLFNATTKNTNLNKMYDICQKNDCLDLYFECVYASSTVDDTRRYFKKFPNITEYILDNDLYNELYIAPLYGEEDTRYFCRIFECYI